MLQRANDCLNRVSAVCAALFSPDTQVWHFSASELDEALCVVYATGTSVQTLTRMFMLEWYVSSNAIVLQALI